MAVADYEFVALSTRKGFNRSLGHFQSVSDVLADLESYRNLADILNTLLDDKNIQGHQLAPVVNALFVGHPKYKYINRSVNLTVTLDEFSAIVEETKKWNSVDMVISYHHPDLGLTLINPKNSQHWDNAQALKINELVTIYCGAFADKTDGKLLEQAIDKLIVLLEGKKITTPPAFTKGKFKQKPPKAPAPAPAARAKRAGKPQTAAAREKEFKPYAGGSAPAAQAAAPTAAAAPAAAPSGKRRMTPMYSIPVTNELFHNGNVEAWKKVIQSYNLKYPGLDVFIFYEGERIHDINTLFKWGKVKHGSAILIAIAGENVQDVAKLRRYLAQGASPMFEAFLRFPVNTVLNLF